MPSPASCLALALAACAAPPSLPPPPRTGAPPPQAAADETLLLHEPALSDDAIAFAWAGDLWSVGRDGGVARRLTSDPGRESDPVFSPDGRWLAFFAQYASNGDVWVMPAAGGEPRRLTFTGMNSPLGFTPDGAHVLFASPRLAPSARTTQLFTVPFEGGFEQPLEPPMAFQASFSPDGKRLAYTHLPDATSTWKRYRGGLASSIWLFDLATREIEELPHADATDALPRFDGATVWFLSDRDGTRNLFAWDTGAKTLRQVTKEVDWEIETFDVRGGTIVYEQAGRLHRLDTASGASVPLKIRCDGDLAATRRRFVPAADHVADMGLSPTGARAIFEARGELFTVPAKKGDVRNLTASPAAHERSPAWSPDGRLVAAFTDAGGEQALALWPQDGAGAPRLIDLGTPPSFFHSPSWSPDGKRIACTDKRLNVWVIEVESGAMTKVDTDSYDHPVRSLDPAWSPDGQWLAYTKRLPNHFRAVHVWEAATGTVRQITPSNRDASSACFTRDGKHLAYLSNETLGLNIGWLDMSSYERPVRSRVHVLVLDRESPSPLAPESDEEKPVAAAEEAKKDEKKADGEKTEEAKPDDAKKEGASEAAKDAAKEPAKLPVVKIDFEGLDQRDLVLPLPPRPWSQLDAADGGHLFVLDEGEAAIVDNGPTPRALWRFDFAERKATSFLAGVDYYTLSGDGKKLLWAASGSFGIVATSGSAAPGDGKLDLSAMRCDIDPRVEWAAMFEQVERLQRDYFYVANLHGADWPAIAARYRPFLPHVGSRDELNWLFSELISELVIGHAYVSGGDRPQPRNEVAGFLGCDFELVDGRYRVKAILDGWNWNLDTRAPLTFPGVKVDEGDFLLAVNHRELRAPQNVFAALLGTAGRQTVLTLGKSADDPNPWTTTVVPVGSEASLRLRAWIEANRRRVDELSKGRVAYAYLPDTAARGYTGFNRDFFAHLDKEGVVIDERFNGGGSVADYVIDLLDRPLLSMWATREGREFPTPAGANFGPKAMIINEYAGSGGDALPLFFKRSGIGKLVGRRTWGGLVGIYDYPPLLDGGSVTAPRLGIYSPDSEWEVENVGVPPDLDVVQTPKRVIEGGDPQLEAAVQVVLDELAQKPVKLPTRPADPDRVKR